MDDGLGKKQIPTIRRRNSISNPVQIPEKMTRLTPKPIQPDTSLLKGSDAPSSLDLELISLKASFVSYTSLRDILPPLAVAINSPTAAGSASNSGYEISIRNRLVKQAAWAYLQPMSAYPDSSGHHLIRRLWLRFSSQNPISACVRFFKLKLLPSLSRFVDWIFGSIGIIFNR